mgnify:CR=1 FL=1
MSVFTKIVTGVFGKKSDRDMKMLTPYIDKINTIYDELVNLTDDELKNRFNKIKDDMKIIAVGTVDEVLKLSLKNELKSNGKSYIKSGRYLLSR